MISRGLIIGISILILGIIILVMSSDAENNISDDAENNYKIPENCTVWFDGCNTCTGDDPELMGCTKMACYEYEEPMCLEFSVP
jgi:hypothetical protein